MEKRIHTVIFDWAGTVIDYGCFAPIHSFLQAFKNKGVEITLEEARQPMGMRKWEHIEEILKMDRVQTAWKETYHRHSNKTDADELYHLFEEDLFVNLSVFTDPLPEVVEVVEQLRQRQMKIGSTTGYTREMMDVVEKHAKEKGYAPDCIVAADQVAKARPYPFMIYQNLMQLESFPHAGVIKVGDTVSDIREGKNAGVWSIGVIKGSNELGLTEEEVHQLDVKAYETEAERVTEKFKSAGADFVIDSIADLPHLIEKIEEKL